MFAKYLIECQNVKITQEGEEGGAHFRTSFWKKEKIIKKAVELGQ